MQDIADWLKKLGMSEYTRRFAEDRIDFSVLPKLTDQHLKDLGVALGDRLKMLAAIRELGISIPASPHPAETGPNGQDTANPPFHRFRLPRHHCQSPPRLKPPESGVISP